MDIDNIDHITKKTSLMCYIAHFGKFILVSIICETRVTISPYGLKTKQSNNFTALFQYHT